MSDETRVASGLAALKEGVIQPGGAAAARWPVWLMYTFAVAVTLATLFLRLGMEVAFGERPLLILFIFPVILSAYAGGLGPGLVSTLLAAASVNYFLIPPIYAFSVAKHHDFVQWCMLMVNGIGISVLSEALHRARLRTERSRLLQAVTLASVGDGVITTDIRGSITFLNQEAERLTGWRQQEAAGQPLTAIFPIVNAETHQPEVEQVEKVLASGEKAILADDLLLLNREGGEVAIEASAAAIKQADGTREGMVLVFQDNSEKKRVIREIERLASFPRLNPFPVLEVDAAGTITFYNQGAVEALEKLGPDVSLSDFLPPDLEEIQTAVRQNGGKLMQREVRIKDAVFSEAISFAAPFDVLRFYTIDITERHQAEEGRIRALMDVQQANESLQTEIWERQAAEEALRVSLRFLEIAHRHTEMKPLLEAFVAEVKVNTGCEAVGIRVLHAGGEIPYLAYQGFDQQFYEMENPLSVEVDQCMCINVVKGTTYSRLPFYSAGGSFYMNGTTRFLATVSEEDKGSTRNVCNQMGYESVALIPLRRGDQILGLIHVADHRENMVPLKVVEILETAGMQLGTAVNRIQAEEALRESEAHFRGLFESMTEGVALHEMIYNDQGEAVDYRVLSVNPAYGKHTGLTPDQIEGQAASAGYGTETAPFLEIYAAVAQTGQPQSFEAFFPPLNRHFQVSATSPKPDHFITVFEDITARKQMEEALKRSEARLRRAEALGHLGHWSLDLLAIPPRVRGSEEMFRIFGISGVVDDFTYHDLLQLVHPEDREYVGQVTKTILEEGQADFGCRLLQPDGELRYINGMGERERNESGENVALFGTILDTTELRQKERELEERNAELERFTYTISHDLKSPLVTIKTFLEYLDQDMARGDGERLEKDMFYLRTAAEKMGRLLDELLEMSRIGRIVNPPVVAACREVVEEALHAVAGSIATRGVEVQVGEMDCRLYGDRPRLVEIWQNLVENAVKFMGDEASPRIEIGMEGGRKEAVFFVCDNGMGIDPRYQEKVFGLFEKLDPRTEGTGLGLALVKRIVEHYRGSIWLESRGPGQGTCFKFTLPMAQKS